MSNMEGTSGNVYYKPLFKRHKHYSEMMNSSKPQEVSGDGTEISQTTLNFTVIANQVVVTDLKIM